LFWALGPEERRLGLDGSDWRFEGRRKDIYRVVVRWSPRDRAMCDLGRVFFELAGRWRRSSSISAGSNALNSRIPPLGVQPGQSLQPREVFLALVVPIRYLERTGG